MNGQTHSSPTFCKLLNQAAFHLAILVHLLIYKYLNCICGQFTGLLEHSISATEPVICSLNSSFVADDSWSQTVTMQPTMQGRTETGVGKKTCVVPHAVKKVLWQVHLVINIKYQIRVISSMESKIRTKLLRNSI